MRPRRTRLAPSPTGALHLGNARTFALTWALARNEGWEILLRVEDLDVDRVKPGAADDAVRAIAWLGLEHDGAIEMQSASLEPYLAAMRALAARRQVFRCDRSRKDVRLAASAPHVEDGEVRYDPSLRPGTDAWGFTDAHANHRFRCDPAIERVHDELCGAIAFDPGLEVGDFLVWTKLGVPAYQLAVVVDDARHGITDVVRGDDLLASAARQQFLHRGLRTAAPRWWHVPLVHAEDGSRLAKRHGSANPTSLAALQAAGVGRERALGLLARLSGFVDRREELSPDDFRALVSADTLRAMVARERDSSVGRPALVTSEDLAWLFGT